MNYKVFEENYQELLNDFLMKPQKEGYLQFLENQKYLKEDFISSYSKNFFGRFQQSIMDVKKKIIDIVRNQYHLLNKSDWENLLKNLYDLTLDPQFILKEGILNIYLNILQLKKEKEDYLLFISILDTIIQILEKALRFYFVFRQYEEKSKNAKKSKLVLSNKSIDNRLQQKRSSKKILESQDTLNQITKRLSRIKVCQLFAQFLQSEQKSLINYQQTCRICSMKVRLDSLQKHLNYCEKKSFLKQRLIQIQEEGEKMFEEIKQLKQNLGQKDNLTQQDKDFIYLSSEIKNFLEKSKKLFRKQSLIGVSKDEDFMMELRRDVQDFIQAYECSENHVIYRFQTIISESQQLTRKRQHLELNYLHRSNINSNSNNEGSSGNSFKSLGESFKQFKVLFSQAPRTRKSMFATKKSQSSIKSNSQKMLYDVSNRKNSKYEKLTKTTRRQKKKIVTFLLNSQQLMEEQQRKLKKKMYHSLNHVELPDEEQQSQISLKNFSVLKFLGKGAFGRVYLVKRRQTGNLYALKVIRIQEDYGQKQLLQIKNEHQIFKKIAGTHLVTAPFSFSQEMGHCFVLQFMSGGDLGKLLAQNVYFQENEAKFYLAQIILAIEHLHKFDIIHRDLKPENLVIDERGHLKLTDFGLSEMKIQDKIKKAKKIMEKIDEIKITEKVKEISGDKFNSKKSQIRLIGTPDYIAPQIINKTSLDNMSIDWWSLGVIAYELMIGCRPFCAETIDQVIDNIVNFRIEWPQIGDGEGQISKNAVDLISKLLNMDYEARLGANGVDEIKSHVFFEGINWQTIKYEKAPYNKDIQSLKYYETYEQDMSLRQQILQMINNKNCEIKSQVKLQNFIRFDLLVQLTYESAQKNISKQDERIKLLKRIADKFQKVKTHQQRRTSLQFSLDQFNIN